MFVGLFMLVKSIQSINRNTLRYVLEFLYEVSSFENENEMTVNEIVKQVGPAIINTGEDSGDWYRSYGTCMVNLLENYEPLFEEQLNHVNLRYVSASS